MLDIVLNVCYYHEHVDLRTAAGNASKLMHRLCSESGILRKAAQQHQFMGKSQHYTLAISREDIPYLVEQLGERRALLFSPGRQYAVLDYVQSVEVQKAPPMYMVTDMSRTEKDMWKIATIMEGDGCISATPPFSMKVSCSQTYRDLDALKFIQSVFGGSIHLHTHSNEEWAQTYDWTICPPAAIDVCKKLAPYMHIKRTQFELGARWSQLRAHVVVTNTSSGEKALYKDCAACERALGLKKEAVSQYLRGKQTRELVPGLSFEKEEFDYEAAKTERAEIFAGLTSQKQEVHSPYNRKLNIAELAGWMISEGHIAVHGANSVSVEIGQKHRAICDALKDTFGGNVYDKTNNSHQWVLSCHARELLQVLEPELIGAKKKQARLLLSTEPGRYLEIKEEMAALSGGQKGMHNKKLRLLAGGDLTVRGPQ